MISQDEARELMAAYALDALSDEERTDLEAVLRKWPEGRRELAGLMVTADALAVVPEQEAFPPLGLEGRLIARARRERSPAQAAARSARAGRRRARPWRLLPYGLAATFAALAVLFAVTSFDGSAENGRWVSLMENDDAKVYATDYKGSPIGVLFKRLEAAPDGKTYQLWQLFADGSVRADQTFQVDRDGRAALALNLESGVDLAGFAVSLEDPGGRLSGRPGEADVRFTFPPN